jgi:hypothetical protein
MFISLSDHVGLSNADRGRSQVAPQAIIVAHEAALVD